MAGVVMPLRSTATDCLCVNPFTNFFFADGVDRVGTGVLLLRFALRPVSALAASDSLALSSSSLSRVTGFSAILTYTNRSVHHSISETYFSLYGTLRALANGSNQRYGVFVAAVRKGGERRLFFGRDWFFVFAKHSVAM